MDSPADDLFPPAPDPATALAEARRLADDVASLLSLCTDLYGLVLALDERDDVSCMELCNHDTGHDGCCETGVCWFERRLAEMTKEVEGDARS